MRIRKEGMEKKQNQDYSLTADMEKAAYDILYKTDESLKESEYTYDQKFKQLYFDLEMQREKSPGYPLVKRGIYYCSRMISRQLTNLTDADYGVLRPFIPYGLSSMTSQRHCSIPDMMCPSKAQAALRRNHLDMERDRRLGLTGKLKNWKARPA